jgi:malonate-semialdehyde dehydrogenase (acetylating) / methylmalonate-semialdehyde dehydrogenase
MSYQVNHYINGEQIAHQGTGQAIHNPATGAVIGEVSFATPEITDKAILAAKTAFPAWSNTPPARRAQVLFKFKTLLEQHLDELATIISQEHGKTLNDARGSVMRGIEVVDFACGIPYLLKGSFAENVAKDVDCYSIRQSLGICVGITPFNFPAMIPLWMFPMAIACGNTFILKPSEKDPSCAVRLAELVSEAGLPAGVVNVLQGGKDVVDKLLTHPDVRAISFVGSTAVAEQIYQTGTRHSKRVQAFGGAKNHCVIMPDADLDQAADALVGAAYGSAGERCMAISVAIAVGNVGDKLIEKLIPKVRALKIGAATAPDIEMGPLISKEHLQRVKSYVDQGVQEGARLVVDGRDLQLKNHEQGFFMGGCLFDHVKASMQIYQKEIFGPVLVVMRVPDFASALALVNEHEYGNGTAIFTRDGGTARTFAALVKVGMIGINVPIPVPVAFQPFGGWKRSLFGDLHMHGNEGMMFYTQVKSITQRWQETSRGAEFTMPTH